MRVSHRIQGVLAVLLALVVVLGIGVSLHRWNTRPVPGGAEPIASPSVSPVSTPILPPLALPTHPRVVIAGDSWTDGEGAQPTTNGYAYVLADKLDWDLSILPNGSGTGYLNKGKTHGTYRTRLAAVQPDQTVDLVIIQGGLNDMHYSEVSDTRYNDAVTATVQQAKTTYPAATVLLLAPLYPEEGKTDVRVIADRIAYSAQHAGAYYINPTAEGWFSAEGAIARYVDPVLRHPNNDGHAYFADRVAADLRSLEQDGQVVE